MKKKLIYIGFAILLLVVLAMVYYGQLPETMEVIVDGQGYTITEDHNEMIKTKYPWDLTIPNKDNKLRNEIEFYIEEDYYFYTIIVTNKLGRSRAFNVTIERIPNQALIVVDIQNTYSSVPFIGKLIKNTNTLIDLAREKNVLVIFVRNNDAKNRGGEYGFEVHGDLHVEKEDIYIDKSRSSAFLETDLNKILEDHGVEKIFMTGLASDFCYSSTGLSAMEAGYEVIAVGDAHSNFTSRPKETIEMINKLFEAKTLGSVMLTEDIRFD